MDTKLTLRLDEEVIREAKRFARSKNTSLSRVVADYFKALSAQRNEKPVSSPILAEIAGVLSGQGGAKKMLKDYKKHLEGKYL